MSDAKLAGTGVLGLRVGDWIEVRSWDEILSTLDEQGCLDSLPFMPEMLKYCGKRFRVYKSAHKTCDTIQDYKIRSMTDAVHLEGLRCDGEAHGGCEAACLLFWKVAWLKPIRRLDSKNDHSEAPAQTRRASGDSGSTFGLDDLARATRAPAIEGQDAEELYRCQATELLRATSPLRWWNPTQYMKDIASRNIRLRDFVRFTVIAVFNLVQRRRGSLPYPNVRGLAPGKTPTATLNLQPGELVQVRSKDEIMGTINAKQRNRGLWFDVEMVPYCGGSFRVHRRVNRIIDEKSGKMIRLPSACIILEGVTCSGCLSKNRLFCPRSIYPYWHEIWLKRVERLAGNPGTPSLTG